MIRDACPRCGAPMGLAGPKTETAMTRWNLRMTVRQSCRHCGAELKYLHSRAENAAQAIGSVALLAGYGGSLWRQFAASALPSPGLLKILFAIGIAASVCSLVMTIRRQHYVLAESAHAATPESLPSARD